MHDPNHRPVRRWALIIGAPGNDPEPLPGVPVDLRSYHDFLRSDHGGAWNSGEIEVLRSPSITTVELAIALNAGIDYSLVVFSGHGHVNRSGITHVWVNNDECCPVSTLNTHAKRQAVVIDACRTRMDELLVEKYASFGEEVGGFHDAGYRASCRNLYDAAIWRAEAGQSLAYACSEGEAAGDTRQGGVFSQTLISLSGDQAVRARNGRVAKGLVDLPTAVNLASAALKQRRVPQTPCLENGRRHFSFPFAVA